VLAGLAKRSQWLKPGGLKTNKRARRSSVQLFALLELKPDLVGQPDNWRGDLGIEAAIS
jgi:hypothetical protein